MLETLLRSIDSRLQRVSEDVGELKVAVIAIEKRLDKVDGRLDRMDERLDRMDERFDRMDERFDRMDSRVDGLECSVAQLRQDILRLPTWKGAGAIAMAVIATFGAIVAWLASGGARALARLFE